MESATHPGRKFRQFGSVFNHVMLATRHLGKIFQNPGAARLFHAVAPFVEADCMDLNVFFFDTLAQLPLGKSAVIIAPIRHQEQDLSPVTSGPHL